MGKATKFLVETGSYCCLCFSKIIADKHLQLFAPKITSFHRLCRYLKIDLKIVFGNNEIIAAPTDAVQISLENSELSGTLCEGCSVVVDKFSEVQKELEALTFQIKGFLHSLHGRMKSAEEDPQILARFQSEFLRGPQALIHYGIVERLRKQALEKCFHHFAKELPRVKMDGFADIKPLLPLQPQPMVTSKKIIGPKSKISNLKAENAKDHDTDNFSSSTPIPSSSSSFGIMSGPRTNIRTAKKFQCTECPATFSYLKSFQHHVQLHLSSKSDRKQFLYFCHPCNKDYKNRRSFQKHQQRHHFTTLKSKKNKNTKMVSSASSSYAKKRTGLPPSTSNFSSNHQLKQLSTNIPNNVATITSNNPSPIAIELVEGSEELYNPVKEEIDPGTYFPEEDYAAMLFTQELAEGDNQLNVTSSSSVSMPMEDYLPEDNITSYTEDQADIVQNTPDLSSQQKLQCNKCGKSFENISSHRRHRRTSRCRNLNMGMIFGNNVKPGQSSISSSSSPKLWCDQCNVFFKYMASFKNHMRSAHSEHLINCDKCEMIFTRTDSLANHKKANSCKIYSAKRFQCDVCQREFDKKSRLNDHMDFVHLKIKMKCDYCPALFPSKNNHFYQHRIKCRRKVQEQGAKAESIAHLQTNSIKLQSRSMAVEKQEEANGVNLADGEGEASVPVMDFSSMMAENPEGYEDEDVVDITQFLLQE